MVGGRGRADHHAGVGGSGRCRPRPEDDSGGPGFPHGQDAVLEYQHEWLAQMSTHPQQDTHGAWLNWEEGRLVGKNPDEPLLKKMRESARVLGARVQGDDCEYYDE